MLINRLKLISFEFLYAEKCFGSKPDFHIPLGTELNIIKAELFIETSLMEGYSEPLMMSPLGGHFQKN